MPTVRFNSVGILRIQSCKNFAHFYTEYELRHLFMTKLSNMQDAPIYFKRYFKVKNFSPFL